MDHPLNSFKPSKPSPTSPSVLINGATPLNTARPKPFAAATVIPTLPTLTTASQNPRTRAQTTAQSRPTPPTTTRDLRQRSGTTGHSRPPPLPLQFASLTVDSRSPQKTASDSQIPRDRPSSPIPIPPRPRVKSPPTTPLTARARSPLNFFGGQRTANSKPYISASLTPYYTTGTRKTPNSHPDPIVQRGFTTMNPRSGSPLRQYTSTSLLSPTRPTSDIGSRGDRRSPKGMKIAGLPPFHPANFPPRDSAPATSSPRGSRSVTSQPRAARGSDAQQKLQKYQREIIASATQSARSTLSDSFGPNPSPPRLTPLSPDDPMTPLALEGGDDYLTAGSRSFGSRFGDRDARDRVEQLLRAENQERNHPDARSRSVSPALSPVLSPALSPA